MKYSESIKPWLVNDLFKVLTVLFCFVICIQYKLLFKSFGDINMFRKKLIILFSKDALNQSKETIIIIQTLKNPEKYVLQKMCSHIIITCHTFSPDTFVMQLISFLVYTWSIAWHLAYK